jgi:CheY-like chemotaxis protein
VKLSAANQSLLNSYTVTSDTLLPATQDNICALVVGEHAGMRRLLKLILGGLALDVDEVSSNHQLLEIFGRLPRVVIVDVDPSYEQGMVVWHMLRRNPYTANIPSVFLVEAGNEFICHLASMAGATICLDKPFHPRQLRTIVEDLLSLTSGPDAADAHCRHVRRPAAF